VSNGWIFKNKAVGFSRSNLIDGEPGWRMEFTEEWGDGQNIVNHFVRSIIAPLLAAMSFNLIKNYILL